MYNLKLSLRTENFPTEDHCDKKDCRNKGSTHTIKNVPTNNTKTKIKNKDNNQSTSVSKNSTTFIMNGILS